MLPLEYRSAVDCAGRTPSGSAESSAPVWRQHEIVVSVAAVERGGPVGKDVHPTDARALSPRCGRVLSRSFGAHPAGQVEELRPPGGPAADVVGRDPSVLLDDEVA